MSRRSRLANLRIRFARTTGSYFLQGALIWKAFRAASTALSTSAYMKWARQWMETKKKPTRVPSSTWQISSPVLGLITGNVLPLVALCHALLMKICVYLISTSEAFESVDDIWRRERKPIEIEHCVLCEPISLSEYNDDSVIVTCNDKHEARITVYHVRVLPLRCILFLSRALVNYTPLCFSLSLTAPRENESFVCWMK